MQIHAEHMNLDQIAQSGQCFRWQPLPSGGYLIPAFGKTLRIRQAAENLFEADCAPAEWDALWHSYFDLDTDYGAIIAGIDPEDAFLTAAAAYGGGIRILRQPLWETIACFIVSQNNNIPRIRGIVGRLCAGQPGFPSPERVAALGEAALRAMGLGYRAPYLHAAAQRFLRENDGQFLPAAGYSDARARLLQYSGIGEKVADCICLFALHHLEAFPMDKWMKRIVQNRYAGHFPLERYPGVQGVMQQYLFYYERSLAALHGRGFPGTPPRFSTSA